MIAPERVARARATALAQRARAARRGARRPLRRRSACCARACCRPSWCSRTRASCAPCHGVRCRERALPAALRGRPGARAGRAVVGARRPHAGAVGRRLRAREPDRAVAHAARGVPRVPRGAARRLLPAPARHAARARAAATATTRASCCSRPGPYNETYFEHAYLARYLGFTLVEGGDLTVRDRARVPEDARRPRAGRRDPAPPRRRLLRSARAAQRLVARRRRASCRRCARATSRSRTRSAAGSSRRPRCSRSCPGLCRALLGEELALPSVATWWCGQADALALRRRAPRRAGDQAGVPGAATRAGVRRAALPRRSARRSSRACARAPHAFVAQEQVALSTAPVWDAERVQPRHLVLRAFAVAAGDGD